MESSSFHKAEHCLLVISIYSLRWHEMDSIYSFFHMIAPQVFEVSPRVPTMLSFLQTKYHWFTQLLFCNTFSRSFAILFALFICISLKRWHEDLSTIDFLGWHDWLVTELGFEPTLYRSDDWVFLFYTILSANIVLPLFVFQGYFKVK